MPSVMSANLLSLSARKQVSAILEKVRESTPLEEIDIIQLSQRDLDLLYSMAYTFYDAGQYQKAKMLFLKLLFSAPFVAAYWKGAGAVSFMLKEQEDALIYYGVAALITPKDPLVHFYAAKVLIDLNRKDEALGAIAQAEALAPADDIDFKAQLEVLYEQTSD